MESEYDCGRNSGTEGDALRSGRLQQRSRGRMLSERFDLSPSRHRLHSETEIYPWDYEYGQVRLTGTVCLSTDRLFEEIRYFASQGAGVCSE